MTPNVGAANGLEKLGKTTELESKEGDLSSNTK